MPLRIIRSLVYRIRFHGARLLVLFWRLTKIFVSPVLNFLLLPYLQKASGRGSRGNNSADKPKVLILRNYYYAKGTKEESTEKNHLDNTLANSGLGEYEVLTYDRDLGFPPVSDLQFFRKCLEVSPDLVLLSSWSEKSASHPSRDVLKRVKKKLGIPLAIIWWDTCSKSFWPGISHLLQLFDLHIVVDNPACHFLDTKNPYFERFLMLWPPQDTALFKPVTERDINVSFLGQISSYRSYRAEQIRYLQESGVSGHFATADRKEQVSHKEYANYFSRSRMSINFSASVSCDQFKSRILEVLYSGAMLLESENDQIRQYFTPFVHYIPFISKEDLLNKVNYYTTNDEERNMIAAAGHSRALEQFGAKQFWCAIFQKLGMAL